MIKLQNVVRTAGAASVAMLAFAGAALADGYEGGSKDAAPAAEGRKFTYSLTLGATSDYVFRGISQSDQDPAAQGSLDIGYGIFYAGVWGSNIDFGDDGTYPNVTAEVDVYAGIKPVIGPFTLDLGVIGYLYPGVDADDVGLPGEVNYVELKAGYSWSPIKNLTSGTTVYWTPEGSFKAGDIWTVESTAGYTFNPVGIFTPTLNGTLGRVMGDTDDGFTTAFDEDEYYYWNVGLAVAVEKFTFDFRYWDTDITNETQANGQGFCEGGNGDAFQCDERFVFSLKVTLP